MEFDMDAGPEYHRGYRAAGMNYNEVLMAIVVENADNHTKMLNDLLMMIKGTHLALTGKHDEAVALLESM